MYIKKGPYLQKPMPHSMTVMWETDEEADSVLKVYDSWNPHVPNIDRDPYLPYRVRLAPTMQGDPIIFTGEQGTMHKVEAVGLQPGHDYYYEVSSKANGKNVSGPLCKFRTAPEKDAPITFVLTSESGGPGAVRNPYTLPMISLIQRERPDFVQSVGDMVYNGLEQLDWDQYFFHPFGELLENTPFYPCVGNHETFTQCVKPEGAAEAYYHYDRFFALPRYYSYDYGCAHFCVLDSPSMVADVLTSDEDRCIPVLPTDWENAEQYRFLTKDLASSDAKWKFVVFHYPPYTSGIFDARALQILSPLLEQYGVDLVFNSHSVIYERTHPIRSGSVSRDGVRYVLVGGYGDFDDWVREKNCGFTAKLASRPCYVRVALTPYSLELQAIDYEGKLFDTLVLTKD